MRFGERLARAVDAHGRICAGIDPHAKLLADWGLSDDAAGVREFALRVVAAAAGVVPAVKPQVAFFERHGSAGIAALEEVIAAGRDAGLLVVVDAKRGDIDTTMAGYADAYLREGSPLAGDALTVSPYLGFGSLTPALDLARENGRGLFVLALTSNPDGPRVQHAVMDGRTVAAEIAAGAAEANAGTEPLGDVGLVIGATLTRTPAELGLDLAALNGPILVPGVGAQGGTLADVDRLLGPAARYALINVSRSVLAQGPDISGLRQALVSVSKDHIN